MITCDRCQKQIKPSLDPGTSEFKIINFSPYIIACNDCAATFDDAVRKIRHECETEYDTRVDYWRNEWLRNYKVER